MDIPIYLQIAATIAAAAGGAFGQKYVETRKKQGPDEKQVAPSASSFQDSLSGVNRRMTELFTDFDQRMQAGFARIENAVSTHTQVHFPALERSVARIEQSFVDHAGREHEELEARVVTLEVRLRRGAEGLAPPKPLPAP